MSSVYTHTHTHTHTYTYTRTHTLTPLLFISIGLILESCPSDILESVCSTAESSLTVLSPPPLPPCPPPLLPPASNRIPSRLPPTVALASHSCFSCLRALSLSLALSLSPTTANRRSYCARARASLSLSRPFSPNALKCATCMASSYFSFEILVLPLCKINPTIKGFKLEEF